MKLGAFEIYPVSDAGLRWTVGPCLEWYLKSCGSDAVQRMS